MPGFMVIKVLRPIRTVVIESGEIFRLPQDGASAAAIAAARLAGKGKVTIRGVEVPISAVAVMAEGASREDALALDPRPSAV
jgi:hypothetical protein